MDVRRIALVVWVASCSAPRVAHVAIAPPSSAPSAPLGALVREDPAPRDAAPIEATREAPWARSFPRAKRFSAIDAPPSTSILLEWRVVGARRSRELPSVVLMIGDREIRLGKLAGSIDPFALTYCARLGWRAESSGAREKRATDRVSSFSLGTIQGDSDFMIVRSLDRLYVLHRETSDGMCERATQGPLDVCKGSEWEVRAEARLASSPILFERVSSEGTAYDCGTEQLGGAHLIAPAK